MEWETFLDDRAHHNLYVNALVYMPTIKMIRRIAKPGDLILEAGCGSGRTAMLLADMGYRVVAVDKSSTLLNRLSNVTAFLPDLNLVSADIGHIPFREKIFKVTYSCGVLEHFDWPEIVGYLREQKKVGTYVLIDVPNDRCVKQCFGDERFYTDEEWIAMLDEAGLAVKKSLHRGLDRGRYVGNCSIFLATDKKDITLLQEKIDVYDHY
ncbi:MAG: class I SAM-dependent methyltransferase [Pseudomonadota bacterium]